MFNKEKEKKVVLDMKEYFNEILFARFNERIDRLVYCLDTYAPKVVTEEEKELIIRNFDDLIFATNAAKEKIASINTPTEKETRDHLGEHK